jgi:hypothetical protein
MPLVKKKDQTHNNTGQNSVQYLFIGLQVSDEKKVLKDLYRK